MGRPWKRREPRRLVRLVSQLDGEARRQRDAGSRKRSGGRQHSLAQITPAARGDSSLHRVATNKHDHLRQRCTPQPRCSSPPSRPPVPLAALTSPPDGRTASGGGCAGISASGCKTLASICKTSRGAQRLLAGLRARRYVIDSLLSCAVTRNPGPRRHSAHRTPTNRWVPGSSGWAGVFNQSKSLAIASLQRARGLLRRQRTLGRCRRR